MSKIAKKDFVFKKHMSIGEADAIQDEKFLADCFVDVGDFDVISSTENSQSIILGRTGVGKSALIEQLANNCERVIRIEPEDLALRHISNSTILNFFENLGVNLDIFYNLLWQHTFAVELIQYHYKIDSQQKKQNFINKITSLVSGNSKKQRALKYIEEWGEKFWADTETRVKEVTEKLESELKNTIDAKVPGVKFSYGENAKLSDEQKSEVVHYGKKVVNNVQIEQLSKIINILSEDIFNDPQKKVFVLIDRLDENWVDNSLRYKLIKALIETIKKFRNIKPVKIIITLRTDLLNRVLEKNKDSGFQPEKYKSFYLSMSWQRDQLKDLLNKRINQLLKYKYTSTEVSFEDVFPAKIDKVTSIDYILDRTMLRPRDAIIFVNECLVEAQGKTEITTAVIKQAEQSYSIDRLNSLIFEWQDEHPNLNLYINLLHGKSHKFKVSELDAQLEDLILRLAGLKIENGDAVVNVAHSIMNASYPNDAQLKLELKRMVLYILFKVGVIGIKIDGASTVTWIHDRTQNLTERKIENTSNVYIHKILWRCLAIDRRDNLSSR